ncbi:methyltransferase [Thalassotalea aquiviva]|uniref:methyltransferase n=1 Tax=Thalassotalea aquiviva TaxID=3242415 RepID=UPI00352A6985
MQSPFLYNGRAIELSRFPLAQVNRSLQAWDAADEYLINHLEQQDVLANDPSIVIFNDSFGALALNLFEHQLTLVNDSYIAHAGIKQNFQDNFIPDDNITYTQSVEPLTQKVDLVILKLPKSNSYLVHQLQQIQQICHSETKVIAAARAKDIHSSTLKLFEKHLGETTTSLAVKKARLIFAAVDSNKQQALPEPKVWSLDPKVTKTQELSISNQANVFSRDSLDIGAAFLLAHLPTNLGAHTKVVDLGCGNGVIGLTLLAQNPSVHVDFIDESYMAISSAKANVSKNLPEQLDQCQFKVNDCLTNVVENSLDLVLCNPPFHQQQAVTDHIAWQMFKQSYKSLKVGGELRIIGNRQLAYHVKLKRLFGHCETIASNKKFVILSAKKS